MYTFYAGKAAIDFVKQYAQSDVKDMPLYAAGFLTEGARAAAPRATRRRTSLDVLQLLPRPGQRGEPQVRRRLEAEARRAADHLRDGLLRRGRGAGQGDRGGRRQPDPARRSTRPIGKLGQIDSPRGTWQFGPKTHSPMQKWYLRQVRHDGRALSNVMVAGPGATVGALTELDAYLIPAVDGVAYGLLLFVVAAGLTLAFGVGERAQPGPRHAVTPSAPTAAALISDGGPGSRCALAVLVGTAAAAAGGAVLSALLAPVAGRGHLAQALLTFGVALVGGDLLVGAVRPGRAAGTRAGGAGPAGRLAGHRYPGVPAGVHRRRRAARGRAVRWWSPAPGSARWSGPPSTTARWSPCLGVNPAWCAPACSPRPARWPGSPACSARRSSGPGRGTADTVLLLSLVVVVLGGLRLVGGALLAAIAVGEIQTLGRGARPDRRAVPAVRRDGASRSSARSPRPSCATGARRA